MKDMITSLIKNFNARPIYIIANGKGWKNDTKATP